MAKIENSPAAYGVLAGLLVFLVGLLAATSGCGQGLHGGTPSALMLLPANPTITVIVDGGSSGLDASPKKDPYGFRAVIDAMRFDGVETTVTWETCGQVNAFYIPSQKRVIMCKELINAASGPVMRYILAHELAHGVIMQRDIPYTGSHEWAADELGSWVLVLLGDDTAVMAGAGFWSRYDRDEDPYDDHPGDKRRAWNLECMVLTHQHDALAEAFCNTNFDRVTATWIQLLGLKRYLVGLLA